MLSALLGRKRGMTQIFTPEGLAVAVTVIETGPCVVTQVKTRQRDGYIAAQIGFEEVTLPVKKTQKRIHRIVNRPALGHLGHKLEPVKRPTPSKTTSKSGNSPEQKEKKRYAHSARVPYEQPLGPFRVLREVKLMGNEEIKLGEIVKASLFKAGELVDVIGISKGKGFAGVVKRHHFSGGPTTHGQSDRLRAPGSIGSGTTPGRVLRGLRMAGRMGNDRVTVQNLQVVQVDPENNLVLVKGAVPGATNSLVTVRKAIKQQPVPFLK